MTSTPDIPPLRDPWMVAAFEGWNDAADAASGVVDHLIDEWDAELLIELDPEDYYDFQVHRPQVRTTDDGRRVILWPSPQIYHARPPRLDRDVLLLRAPEPNFHWKAFCSTVLGVAKLAGVTEMVTLGALLADSPHTRPVPVTGSTSDPVMIDRMSMQPSTYNGPIGITSVLGEMASQEGIAAASLWAAVPHYLAEPPCPKATLALLGALEDAIGAPLPQGVLVEMSEAWQRGAEDLTSHDPEIAEYVEALENERDTSELPEASGDAIAKEFERYLRRRNVDPE
ncbi:PAC2 family protein [Aeromicrobium wangtongii]|uniref:PAC2 family protein n=1 Tax=Aeromicrobium wangtongii TaxID=2969247 RepID=UPI002017FBC0|nr:PAC2 family protein [Aeromicrobium wangtongii]MCL3819247.1 PAC2 family protein [Aeromicrobium wangtongii]